MSDFDLRQALDGDPDFSETGHESRCLNATGKTIRLKEGVDLVVSQDPKTLRSVAFLVLGVTRMKKVLAAYGRELKNNELCSAIMESLVIETIVESTTSSTGVRRVFHRVNSEETCTLSDMSQKDVVQVLGELKAITLKGGAYQRKVNFKLSRYITGCVSAEEGQTVLLSINNNHHISCSMKDGKAVLTLEQCSEQDLRQISDDRNMDRFLFYRRNREVSLNTFESVKCRGWFISTSCEAEDQPVQMCSQLDAARRLTRFKMTS